VSDFSQPERHQPGRGLSDDTAQPTQAADRKIAHLPFALRLLAHPTHGARGITDRERRHLLDAARFIEDIGTELDRLTKRVLDISIEADSLRAATA